MRAVFLGAAAPGRLSMERFAIEGATERALAWVLEIDREIRDGVIRGTPRGVVGPDLEGGPRSWRDQLVSVQMVDVETLVEAP